MAGRIKLARAWLDEEPTVAQRSVGWAARKTRALLDSRWLIGGVGFALVAGVAGGIKPPSESPETVDRVLSRVGAALIASIGLLLVVFLGALIAAPYRQRAALRAQLGIGEPPKGPSFTIRAEPELEGHEVIDHGQSFKRRPYLWVFVENERESARFAAQASLATGAR